MQQKELRKIALAAMMIALSVAIDVLFKQFIPGSIRNIFGFPFYAIPLIIGSILLGPIYGVFMGGLADFLGVYIAGDPYLPLFIISSFSWSIIPALIVRNEKKWTQLLIAILIAHIIATATNTYALAFYRFPYLDSLLWVRLSMIPVNVMIISYVTYQINLRLTPLYLDFKKKTSDI